MKRSTIALTVAAAHLVLVALGAAGVDLAAAGLAGRSAALYAALSGADTAYGYFAPDFTAEPWATFEVVEPGGRVVTEALETGASREADFRVRNLVATSLQAGEGSMRAVAAACAGKILARHPRAESVVVRLATYDLPTMEEHHAGKRAAWRVHYEARFARGTGQP